MAGLKRRKSGNNVSSNFSTYPCGEVESGSAAGETRPLGRNQGPGAERMDYLSQNASLSLSARRGNALSLSLGLLITIVNALGFLSCEHLEEPPNQDELSGRLVFDSPDFVLYTITAEGTGKSRITSSCGTQPSFSRDGRTMAFFERDLSDGSAWVSIVHRSSSTVQRLAMVHGPTDAAFLTYAWSPDGRSIAFNRSGATGSEICIVSLADLATTQLTHDNIDFDPLWSPDGSRILFMRTQDSIAYKWSVDCAGQNCCPLTYALPKYVQGGDWSPDGVSFAFWCYESNKAGKGMPVNVYVYSTITSTVRRLTSDSVSFMPRFIENGRRLLFSKSQGAGVDLYVMNSDGSDIARLTNHGLLVNGSYKCSPSGSKIAYLALDPLGGNFKIHLVNVDGTGDIDTGERAWFSCNWIP